MRQLTEELHRVSNEMMRLREEMGQHWKLPKDKKVKLGIWIIQWIILTTTAFTCL